MNTFNENGADGGGSGGEITINWQQSDWVTGTFGTLQ